MAQPETLLVARIRKRLAQEFPGSWSVKIAGGPYQTSGLPDLWVVHGGRLAALEVKRQRPDESEEHARGRATPRQLAVIAELRAAGAVAAVVLDEDEAVAACREAFTS